MSAHGPFFTSTASEDLQGFRHNWGWIFGLGVALIIVGLVALGYPVATTVVTHEIFGILLRIAGVIEVCSCIWARRSGGFFQHLLSGLLYLFLGVVLVERPGIGAAVYTLLMAVFFVAAGLFRIVFALGHRFEGRALTVLSGVVALLLGIMIWRNLPEAALWVIGTFVGIELVFNGLTWVMLGLAARRIPETATTSDAPSNRLIGV